MRTRIAKAERCADRRRPRPEHVNWKQTVPHGKMSGEVPEHELVEVVVVRSSREDAIKRLKAQRDFKQLVGVAVAVSVLTVVIWAATGAEYFWPMWPILGMAIAVLAAAWQVWAPGERPITEEQIAEDMRRG